MDSSFRPHLVTLDGIRGLTSIYVVLFHACQPFLDPSTVVDRLPRSVWWSSFCLSFGRPSVGIFIVLSGYCLMIPVVREPGRNLGGGVVGFLWKRTRRILPPYYIALAFSILVLWCLPFLREPLDAWTVLSHVFLIHNLFTFSIYAINVPMWSIATEFQIYLAFALVLHPIYKRFGIVCSLAVAFCLGVSLRYLFDRRLTEASPDYLGLFGLGMLAAVLNFSTDRLAQRLETKLPWAAIAWSFALVHVGIITGFHYWGVSIRSITPLTIYNFWPMNTLVGLATACALIHCTRSALGRSSPGPLQRFLSSRPMVRVGIFSYSLYLVHEPLLRVLLYWLQTLKISSSGMLGLSIILGLSLSLSIAYLFHLVFERPFMPGIPFKGSKSARSD